MYLASCVCIRMSTCPTSFSGYKQVYPLNLSRWLTVDIQPFYIIVFCILHISPSLMAQPYFSQKSTLYSQDRRLTLLLFQSRLRLLRHRWIPTTLMTLIFSHPLRLSQMNPSKSSETPYTIPQISDNTSPTYIPDLRNLYKKPSSASNFYTFLHCFCHLNIDILIELG